MNSIPTCHFQPSAGLARRLKVSFLEKITLILGLRASPDAMARLSKAMEEAFARAHRRFYKSSADPAHQIVGEAFEAPMVKLLAVHLRDAGLDPELARPAMRDLRNLTGSYNVAIGRIVVSRNGPAWRLLIPPA